MNNKETSIEFSEMEVWFGRARIKKMNIMVQMYKLD